MSSTYFTDLRKGFLLHTKSSTELQQCLCKLNLSPHNCCKSSSFSHLLAFTCPLFLRVQKFVEGGGGYILCISFQIHFTASLRTLGQPIKLSESKLGQVVFGSWLTHFSRPFFDLTQSDCASSTVPRLESSDVSRKRTLMHS